MCNYDNIFQTIYKYYPQNCKYSDDCNSHYKKTIEYLRYKNVLNDLKLRETLRDKLFKVLKSVFVDYHVEIRNGIHTYNHSYLYPSLQFTILLHKNQPILDDDEELLDILKGTRLDLEVYFSLLSNHFYTFAVKTVKDPGSKNLQFSLQDELCLIPDKIHNLENVCKLVDYEKLDYQTSHIIVPNIEIECLNEGEVKIFNCLFSDIVTMF